jgi:hypothetical protein
MWMLAPVKGLIEGCVLQENTVRHQLTVVRVGDYECCLCGTMGSAGPGSALFSDRGQRVNMALSRGCWSERLR